MLPPNIFPPEMIRQMQITAPNVEQVMLSHNPVWWKSALVGITAPFLNLPQMVWRCLLRPMLCGLAFIIRFTLRCWINGLFGNIVGMPIVFMTPDQFAREAQESK
jgi:hypothetical protein